MSNPFFFPWNDPEYKKKNKRVPKDNNITVYNPGQSINVSMEVGDLEPPIIGEPESETQQ